MKVCLIGLGSIGMRHLRNLRDLGVTDFVLCDTDLQKFITADVLPAGSVTTTGPELALNHKPDAVLICTPAATHAAMLKLCARQSSITHIFCEKPLAISVAEAEDATKDLKAHAMVGYQLRFNHHAAWLRHAVPNADMGEFQVWGDMREWPGGNYSDFMLEMSHEVDLARWFLGDASVRWAKINPDRAEIELAHDGCLWSRVTMANKTDYGRYWRIGNEWQWSTASFRCPEILGEQMYLDEMAHFLEAARAGSSIAPPAATLADGLAVLRLIEAAKAKAGAK